MFVFLLKLVTADPGIAAMIAAVADLDVDLGLDTGLGLDIVLDLDTGLDLGIGPDLGTVLD